MLHTVAGFMITIFVSLYFVVFNCSMKMSFNAIFFINILLVFVDFLQIETLHCV